MADGSEHVGEEAGRTADRVVDLADHPLVYALAITLMVIAMMALLYYLFVRLGLDGPASLIR